MTAFARYSSTTRIATAIYAWLTKSPSISKLTSGTSSNVCCSAVTRMAAMHAISALVLCLNLLAFELAQI